MENRIIALIDQIKVNRRDNQYAVYKPLLLLLILNDISEGRENSFSFKEIYPRLQKLMERYGWETVSRKKAEYPFFFLASSVLWEINIDSSSLKHPDAPSKAEMENAVGRLNLEVYQYLKSNPNSIKEAEEFILMKFFGGSKVEILISL